MWHSVRRAFSITTMEIYINDQSAYPCLPTYLPVRITILVPKIDVLPPRDTVYITKKIGPISFRRYIKFRPEDTSDFAPRVGSISSRGKMPYGDFTASNLLDL